MIKLLNEKIRAEYSHIRSLLICKDNKIIVNENFQGIMDDDYHHVASITKSITCLVIGNALESRWIDDLDIKLIDVLPEIKKYNECEYINEITIENILTMTTGLGVPELNSNCWENKKNIIKHIFDYSFSNKPGEEFNYNTAICHLLSLVIKRATGLELIQYADQNVFQKIGIIPGIWKRDFNGNGFAGHSAHFKILDLLTIAKLLQNNGRYLNIQIVPESIIKNIRNAKSEGGDPEKCNYGYLFWINKFSGIKSYFASGFGGQYIYIIDELNLIIIITSNRDKPHMENRKLIEEYIVPMIE